MADEFLRGKYTFLPNMANIQRLKATREMEFYMGMRARMAASKAQQIAPVDTGDYQAGIEGQSGFVDGAAIGRVVATDWKSGWIEFGTRMWPAHATLRLGAEASGLRVRGGSKLRWRPKKSGGWY